MRAPLCVELLELPELPQGAHKEGQAERGDGQASEAECDAVAVHGCACSRMIVTGDEVPVLCKYTQCVKEAAQAMGHLDVKHLRCWRERVASDFCSLSMLSGYCCDLLAQY